MANDTYRIVRAKALKRHKLRVEYAGGTVVDVDMKALIERSRIFKPLADAVLFAKVKVGDYGWSVEWNDDAALDSDRVMEMALEQEGRTDTLAFREWQDRNGLSLAEAADAIGMTRRTASQYRTGARPVPRTVLLALKGWEAERRVA